MHLNTGSKILTIVDQQINFFELFHCEEQNQGSICWLQQREDAIAQITQALAANPTTTTLHLLSHGQPGCLYIGDLPLTLETLGQFAREIKQWSQLAAVSNIILYGCEVAQGAVGQAFIAALRELTGAAIAASTTPIGAQALGGNWDLDYRLGNPVWQTPFSLKTRQAYPALLGAPSIEDTFQGTRTVAEDGTLTFSHIAISDTGAVDGDPAETQAVSLSITAGTLTLTNTTGLSNVVGNGSTSISFEGAVSDVNTAIASLEYTPVSDTSGGLTLAITTNDGINTPVSLNVPFAVTAVNDDSALLPTTATVDEGGSVTFADSNFGLTDVDNLPEQIILKFASLPAKGSLRHGGAPVVVGSTFSSDTIGQLVYVHDGTQTSVSGGTDDSFSVTVEDGAGGFVSSTAIPITINPVNQPPAITGEEEVFEGEPNHPIAINIVDPDQTAPFSVEIRSLPIDGILKVNGVDATIGQVLTGADLSNVTYSHNGNDDNDGFPPDDSFDVRLVDDGGGTGTPAIVDTTVPIRIIPNNDDPTLAVNAGVTLSAGTGRQVTITDTLLQVTDPDSTDAQLTYTVTQLPTQGLVLRDGARLVVGSTFTQEDINLGLIEYIFSESAGASGTTDSFTFTVRDAELRNWPSLREGGIYADEEQNTPLSEIPFSIAIDPTTPSGPGLGGGGGGGDADTFPADLPNAPSTGDIDGGAGITNLGVALNEGGTVTITNAELVVTDTDSNDDQIIYRLMSVPTGGTLKLGNSALKIYDSFSQANINNNQLTFEQGGGEVFNDAFTFTLSDGKNVSTDNGAPFEFEIDVNPINDSPFAQASENPFVQEGNTVTIDNTFLSLNDVDGTGQQPDHLTSPHFADSNILTFQITTLPQFGTLLLNGSAIAPSTVMTKADLDNGNLEYEHAGNEEFADFFEVQVNDNTNSLGATNHLSSIERVNIDIAKLNDDPQFSSSIGLKVAEGGSGVIKGSNYTASEPHLIYTDPDNSTIQRQYRITSAVQYGQLTLAGKVLGVGSVFTQNDLDSDRIQYEHDGSENFSDFFEFGVRDGGGVVVPGIYNITIDPPVNDAPELAVPKATQTFDTTAPFEFSNAQGNAITIDDPDLLNVDVGEVDLIRVTLDLQAGGSTYGASTLTLADTTGLNFTTGASGSAGGILTFEGTLADVQAAIAGLTVQVPTDEDRTLDLVVTVDDRRDPLNPSADPLLANNGGRDPIGALAGYNIVTKTIKINASNVNDPPTVSVPATAAVNEDGTLAFNGGSGTGFASVIAIDDPDAFSADLQVTLSIDGGSGGLSAPGATGNGTTSLTLTGTETELNTALQSLIYTPTAEFNGTVTLTVEVDDQGNTGGTAQTVTDTVTVTVNPLNDQPEVTVPDTQVIDDNNPLTLTAGAIAIGDTPDLTHGSDYGAIDNFTVTIAATQTSNGGAFGELTFAANGSAIVANNGTDTVTITGTLADVNATLDTLSYIPDIGNVDDQIRITVTVNDGDNGAEGTSSSGESTTNSDSFLINVSDVNEPPVLASPGNLTADEDSTLTLTGANTFSFADPDDFGANNLEATVTVANGTLSLVGDDGASVSGSGTNTLTLTGTEAQINNALDGLQFTPTPDFHGNAGNMTVTVNDKGNTGTGGEQTDTQTIAIAVNSINDRPSATGSISLATGTEDITPSSTETFANLVTTNNNYNDTTDDQTANAGDDDKTPLSYVAIVGSPNYDPGQGTWQVSSDGNTWLNISTSSLSETNALVFPKDWQVRFAPANDFHGTPGSLNIRLADSSTAITASTTTTDYQNLISNGGTGPTGAWSLDSVLITVFNGITSINDAPTIDDPASPAALTNVDEDTVAPAGDTVFNLFNPKYVDITDDQSAVLGGGDDATPLAGVAITANAADPTTQGYWQYNTGSGWTDVPTLGLGDGSALVLNATDRLRFVPVADYNGTPGRLTVRLSDGTNFATGTSVDISGELGNTHGWSADPTGLETIINPVNDAPVLDSGPARSLTPLDEDTAAPSNGAIVGNLVSNLVPNSTDITDIDAGAVEGIAITDIQNGALYYSLDNGTTWQAAATPTESAALLLANDSNTRLFFEPDDNVNGTFDALTFRAWDRTSGINGGTADTTTHGGTTAFSTARDAIAITINPINDAPRRSQSNAFLANAPEDTITPSSSTIAGLLTAAFDDSDDDQTALSGSTANSLAGFAIHDNNTSAAQGTWQWFNTTTSSWQDIGTGLSNSNALVLAANTEVRFVPTLNFNGRSGRLRGHLIDDSDGAVNAGDIVNLTATGTGGTTPYSNQTDGRVSLWARMTPVNDAPLAAGTATISAVSEDDSTPAGNLISSLIAPNFDDSTDDLSAYVSGSAPNALSGIAIVGNATTSEGTWQYFDGSTWTAIGNPTASTALLVAATDSLRFMPGANYNGPIPDLTVHVIDDFDGAVSTGAIVDLSGSGATGGTTVYSIATVPINGTVTPVNDAPDLSGTVGITFQEGDVATIFASGASVSDIDAPHFNGGSLAIALDNYLAGDTLAIFNQGTAPGEIGVSGSTITYGGTPIGTVSGGNGSDLTITFTSTAATLAAAQALVEQLTFFTDSNDPTVGGTESTRNVTITLNDGGNTGSGGPKADQITGVINLVAVNNPPELDSAIANQSSIDSTSITPLNIASSFSDLDPSGDLVFTASGLPPGLTIAANGEITGILDADASQGGASNNGVYTVTVTATDDQSATVSDTFTWTVTNPAPIATNNTATVTEDSAPTDSGNLITENDGSGIDSDPDSDTLAVSQIQSSSNTVIDPNTDISGDYGTLNWDSNGGYTYSLDNSNVAVDALDDGETLTETFIYTVDDGEGGTDTASLIITIAGQNDGPEIGSAIADQSNLDADPISLTVGNNFTDVDLTDDLTFAISGLPPGLTFDSNTGEISGTLDMDASQGGTDGIYVVTVTAKDNNHVTISDTFNWTIKNPPPVATANTATVTEDGALTDSGNLLTDEDGDGVDRDSDGDGITVSQIRQGATVTTDPTQDLIGTYGTLNWNTAGGYTYTLDNANPIVQALDDGETLTDVFTYTLKDGDGDTNTSLLTITVTGANDAPLSTPLGNQNNPDSTVIPGLDISGNFSDRDISDSLEFMAIGLPTGLSINQTTGIISGTIANNASQGGPSGNGLYTVTVTATDDNGASTSRSFVWAVSNPGLTATNNTATVSEETPLSDSGNLLTDDDGNGIDTDIDGDPITVTAIAHNGITTTNPAQDSSGSYGTLNWDHNGTYTYTLDNTHPAVQALDAGEALTEVFTYSVSDGQGSVGAALLTVTITGTNDVPQIISTIDDQTSTDAIAITPIDISGYFDDPDTNGTLTFTATELPLGLILDSKTGLISGSPAPNASQGGTNGSYAVIITATDNQGGTIDQSFTWTVTNPAPIATDNIAKVSEDASLSDNGNLIADDDRNGSDSDPDGDALIVAQIVRGSNTVSDPDVDIIGTYGTLNWDSNGDYIYTLSNTNPAVQALDEGETLTDEFTYTLSDGEGGTDTAILAITITGQNDAPTASSPPTDQSHLDQTAITPLDISNVFQDPDTNDLLTFTASGLPSGLTFDATTGLITGTLDRSASQGGPSGDGIYPVTITATDNNGAAISQTFIWTVANPGITAVDNTATVSEDNSLSDRGNLITDDDGSGVDSDADGDSLAVIAIAHNGITNSHPAQASNGTYGSLNWNPDGSYTYTLDNANTNVQALNDGDTLTDLFTYSISDGQGSVSTAQLIVTITGQTDNSGWNGSNGDDIVTGVDPNGGISGLSDPDVFYGYAGNDIINGGSDIDQIDGGDDNDVINGGSGPDVLLGRAGNDMINSGSGPDFVDGGTGDDRMMGSSGDDVLVGGAGNDELNGGLDNDLLVGGPGADTLIGGQGNDTFQFSAPGDGGDTIVDFEIVRDRIQLVGFAGISFESLQLQQVGADTLISLPDGPIALLQAVNASTLRSEHFIFDKGHTEAPNIAPALSLAQADDYLASHPDLIAALGYNLAAAQNHYMEYGYSEGRAIDTFAEEIYLAAHPDLISAFGYDLTAATRHYIEFGHGEGRTAKGFLPESYLAAYDDLKAAFGNDLTAATRHYIQYGYEEGRDHLLGFDGAAYIASHADLVMTFGHDPAAGRQHFLQYGHAEGRAITFEGDDYIASHSDLITTLQTDLAAGIAHYINFGMGEGRGPDAFDEVAYLSKYADLQAGFGNDTEAATMHYIEFGFLEGRTA